MDVADEIRSGFAGFGDRSAEKDGNTLTARDSADRLSEQPGYGNYLDLRGEFDGLRLDAVGHEQHLDGAVVESLDGWSGQQAVGHRGVDRGRATLDQDAGGIGKGAR